jgi:hypothetical protein
MLLRREPGAFFTMIVMVRFGVDEETLECGDVDVLALLIR